MTTSRTTRKGVGEGMGLSAVNCRLALAVDLPELLACDAYAQTRAERVDELKRWVTAGQCHLAVGAGHPLGYVVWDHSFFGQAFIHLVCVAEPHQRQGIGRLLLAHAEQQCGRHKLFTSTNASNIKAQRLLLAAGFVRSGCIDNLDEADPEWVFFKRVDPVEPLG